MSQPTTSIRRGARLVAFAIIAVALEPSLVRAASSDNKPPAPTVDAAHVCLRTTKTLNTGPLLRAEAKAYHSSLTSDQIARLLAAPINLDSAEIQSHPEVLKIYADMVSLLNGAWGPSFKVNDHVTVQQYFSYYLSHEAAESYPVECLLEPAVSSAATQTGFRLRGTVDDLSISKADGGFAGASKATLSLSDNQVTKITASQIQGALGYAIATDANGKNLVIPYVAGSYNANKTVGKAAKVTANTLDFGVTDVAKVRLGILGEGDLSLAPDYLHNFQDGSSIVSLHPMFAPILPNGAINSPYALSLLLPGVIPASDAEAQSGATYLTLLFDVRSDLGVYTNRGVPMAAPGNLDFVRIGSRFGVDIAKKNWFEFTATDVQLYAPAGARRYLSDFESSFTFYFGTQNTVGVTASYKTGLTDPTLTKEQIWSLGLTAKY